MVLKLITIAATISAAKGQGDGDHSSDEGVSFGWIVTFYTALVMIGTLVGWYLLTEGVSLVSDRSTPWTPVRRARKSANKMKEESEKEEECDSLGNAHHSTAELGPSTRPEHSLHFQPEHSK